MKKILSIAALFIALPFATHASAANTIVDIDLHTSTLGSGVGFAIPVTETLAGRVSLNKFKYSFESDSDGTKFNSTLNLESLAALADWHLFNGITHLTAGIIYNNNSFSMNAIPNTNGSFTINNQNYAAGTITSLNAEITFNKVAPYLGFGWSGKASNSGFSFKSDFGVMFQGAPQSRLSATGSAASAAASDIAAAEAQLNRDMSSFNIYPVISVGIGYAF